mmetsp:Transcript_6829/g.13405  ORF Transcript_6829/g.13405 Transcript_6829/m.13405 type:complete len:337 (+) Transcript_6829:1069-2079(+)
MPVVRHHQEGLLVSDKIFLQPDDGGKVQVVRRLVEEKDVRIDEQRAGQRHPHPPPSRERRCGDRLSILAEPQAREDARRARIGGVGIDLLESLVDLLESVGPSLFLGLRFFLLRFRFSLLVLRQPFFLFQEHRSLHIRSDDGIDHRARVAAALLLHVYHPEVRGEPRDFVVGDVPKKRGLTDTVPSDEPHAASGGEAQGRRIEQLRRAVGRVHREVVDVHIAALLLGCSDGLEIGAHRLLSFLLLGPLQRFPLLAHDRKGSLLLSQGPDLALTQGAIVTVVAPLRNLLLFLHLQSHRSTEQRRHASILHLALGNLDPLHRNLLLVAVLREGHEDLS